MIEVILEFENGMIRNVNLPPRISVHVNDYDTDKYSKDTLEKDSSGEWCKQTIWTRFAYKNNQPVKKIDHVVHIGVRKRKVCVWRNARKQFGW